MIPHKLKDIDVLLLAGGLGTRLRSVSNKVPKVLVSIHGKPFLELLIDNLVKQGFRRIIICVGYLKDQVLEQFLHRDDCQIIFSEEENPLGTGGALKNAQDLIKSNEFIMLNGDSFCDVDYQDFHSFHVLKRALISMVVTDLPSSEKENFGNIELNSLKRIISFKEKVKKEQKNNISAGIYLMNKEIFNYMPKENSFSIEYDVFPNILKNRCFGYVCSKELFDIGTPSRLRRANKLFLKLFVL